MINSDSLGSSTSISCGFSRVTFFFFVRFGRTDFLFLQLSVCATTMTNISCSNSVLYTLVVGILDRASAAWCFTAARSTIRNSYYYTLNRQRYSIFVTLARFKIHGNAWWSVVRLSRNPSKYGRSGITAQTTAKISGYILCRVFFSSVTARVK